MTTTPSKHPLVGQRVRIPNPATGPQTGVGRPGIIVGVWDREPGRTSVDVDVQLDDGYVVTRELRDLSIIAR